MRYKITIEYDGTHLLGWQRQLDGPSAQDFLEKAIHAFSGQTTVVSGAGRTDTGVHALAQVAHFDIETKLDPFRIREAVNAHLRRMDAPVAVLEAEEADANFHARFSATGRSYIYRILNRRAPTILDKDRVWWIPVPLDIKKMQKATKHLLGKHNFTSFRAAACQAQSPVKTLDKLEITQTGEEIIFKVEARSFLHRQVRNIVGTLKMVGDQSIEPDMVKEILKAQDRTKAGATAPASGLYLSQIKY